MDAYGAAASASWASSLASATLAAAVLARRLVLSDPVPISASSTVGIKRQQEYLWLILGSLTFASRGPHRLVFRTT